MEVVVKIGAATCAKLYKDVQRCTNQIITIIKPTPNFLQAGCPSCRPTNSVKALKGKQERKSIQ